MLNKLSSVASRHPRIIEIITWIARLLTGSLFIFSGFVKGIDPWGLLYKFQDYFAAMHLEIWHNVQVVGVFTLCIFEFIIGVFLLLGCFRRATPILSLLFMGVMLPLTLWIALANPVPDCGCFGDALVISNWATFWKNVVLVALVGWLVKFNTSVRCIIKPNLQWVALLVSGAYLGIIILICYIYQPLIDFRPYPVGSSLAPSFSYTDDDAAEEFLFVYEHDGVEKSFTIDSLPDEDEGWEFVGRQQITPAKPVMTTASTKETGFRIWSEDGEEDMTDDVISDDGKMLMILMPDLVNVSVATTWKINSLKEWADKDGVEVIGVAAATPEQIAEWRDISLADYPIYTAEDTEIKMLARGNPAVVMLDDGKVRWKSSLRALPAEDFLTEEADVDPDTLGRDDHRILLNLTGIYIALLIGLSLLSYTPSIFKKFFRTLRRDRDVS